MEEPSSETPRIESTRPSKTDIKIGLALSGGGFRATLFHLGVVRFLRDSKLLSSVATICSVSGGSVLGAHLIRNWAMYCSEDDEIFAKAATDVLRLVRHDVRGRVVRRALFGYLYRPWSRTRYLAKCYDAFLGERPRASIDQQLPDLHILTTNLTTGDLCSFELGGFSVHKRSGVTTFQTDLLTDGTKVAASSAFPALFQPLRLTAADLGIDKQGFGPAVQFFTDGGVYDNKGIRKFDSILSQPAQVGKAISFVLLSDAGLAFDPVHDVRVPMLHRTIMRSNDILMYRIGELDLEVAGFEAKPDERYRLVSIAQEVDPKNDPDALPQDIQRRLKFVRTDLDEFSDLEIRCLVQHGYTVARDVLRATKAAASDDLAKVFYSFSAPP